MGSGLIRQQATLLPSKIKSISLSLHQSRLSSIRSFFRFLGCDMEGWSQLASIKNCEMTLKLLFSSFFNELEFWNKGKCVIRFRFPSDDKNLISVCQTSGPATTVHEVVTLSFRDAILHHNQYFSIYVTALKRIDKPWRSCFCLPSISNSLQ